MGADSQDGPQIQRRRFIKVEITRYRKRSAFRFVCEAPLRPKRVKDSGSGFPTRYKPFGSGRGSTDYCRLGLASTPTPMHGRPERVHEPRFDLVAERVR